MSAHIPTITAHKQMQLVTRGFDIQHKAIEHKGEHADEFTVEFQKATRRFRFFFAFKRGASILFFDGVPVFVVSKKDPLRVRRSQDWAAMEVVDAFFREIGFCVTRTRGSYVMVQPIKHQVAA